MSDNNDFTYIEGKPYRGRSRFVSPGDIIDMTDLRRFKMTAPDRVEEQSMQRVRLVVPFHTTINGDGDDDLDQPSALEQANVEVIARFSVQDADQAQPLIAAAEVLGFRCLYDSRDPHNDDELGIVTIIGQAIAE